MAILNSMSSIIKPGRATLVLGPPGAGKSTLLKAMAGKLSPHGLKVTSTFCLGHAQCHSAISPLQARETNTAASSWSEW